MTFNTKIVGILIFANKIIFGRLMFPEQVEGRSQTLGHYTGSMFSTPGNMFISKINLGPARANYSTKRFCDVYLSASPAAFLIKQILMNCFFFSTKCDLSH